ncbi:MAG: RNA 2',3'-cyclic phosphodiesterase [Pseudomonadota bacterium]
MPRLFVGLTIPSEIQHYLLFAQGGVTHARWQSADQLHLTLRFIGDVDGRTASDIETALDTISFAPFDVYAEGVGVFGKVERARSVWASVKPRAALTALHNKIDQALNYGAGLPPETRQYEPHITLARFSGRHGRLNSFLESAGGLRTPPWQVDHFSLFLSTLGSTGAHYTVLGNFGGLDNPWALEDESFAEPEAAPFEL